MIVRIEKSYVETVYIMGAKTQDKLVKEMYNHMDEGYTVIGQNEVDYGSHIEYNARLQKHIKEAKIWVYK